MGVNQRGARQRPAGILREADLPEQRLTEPPTFGHVPLLVAPGGRRLSKRDRDLDLGGLREAGLSSSGIIGALASTAGLVPVGTVATPEELIPAFSWQKLATGLPQREKTSWSRTVFWAEGSS